MITIDYLSKKISNGQVFKLVKKKAAKGGFPHDILESLVFNEEFPDLEESMNNPLRQLSKIVAQVAGDALYTAINSGGNPNQFMAGQLRVAIDNMEAGPNIAKTAILGGMRNQVNDIIKKSPKPDKAE